MGQIARFGPARDALGRPGFSPPELLVAMGIMGVFAALLLPAINQAREASRTTQCLANLHALGVAWLSYASDNNGALVLAVTGPGGWVNSGNDMNQYTTGLLFPYVPTIAVFACPDAANESNTRSYSLNEVFDSPEGIAYWKTYLPGLATQVGYYNLRQIVSPAATYVFIEEFDPRGYNEGGFVVPRTGSTWVDFPAHRHRGNLGGSWDSAGDSCCLNFADGRAECWKFDDLRTTSIGGNFVTTPNNPDLIRIQGVLGF